MITATSTRLAICFLAVTLSMAAAETYGGTTVSSSSTTSATLTPTPAQVPGPYFLANSPFRDNLIPAGMTGQPIKISGQVLAVDGSVVPNATVHVWLADPHGAYDNQDAQGNPIAIPVAQQKLRGRIKADNFGKYAVTMLRPGNYEVSAGKMRPAHIHIRVEAAGYKTLITQLYFTDDKFNTQDLPGDGFFKPELLVPLTAGALSTDPQTGTFNFVLRK